jgi:type I restriction enzyme S subunit
MKSEWKECKLSELVLLQKEVFKPDTNSNHKYIGLEHIGQGSLRVESFGNSSNVESNKWHFQIGDVLFGKLRPYFRKVAKAKFSGVCSTDIWVCRATEGNSQDFLFYFLANQEFVDTANATDEGTRMPRADWSYLKDTIWTVPPLPVQRTIAEVLSSLDDKIDLLTRQNATREALAQTYFRQWFVERDTPIGRLDSIAKITMGQSPRGESYNESGIGTVFFQGRGEFGWRYTTVRLYTTEPQRMAQKGDILMSVRAPVGDINIADEDCCVGRGLAAIHSEYPTFTLYALKEQSEQLEIFNGEGTVFGSISKDGLNGLEIHLPSKQKITKFEEEYSILDKKIASNSKQILTLQKLRDTLLPKLISGEVRVKQEEYAANG